MSSMDGLRGFDETAYPAGSESELILSRVGVTWYTFKQKAPKFRADWYKGAYFFKIVNFFGHYNRLDTSEGKHEF